MSSIKLVLLFFLLINWENSFSQPKSQDQFQGYRKPGFDVSEREGSRGPALDLKADVPITLGKGIFSRGPKEPQNPYPTYSEEKQGLPPDLETVLPQAQTSQGRTLVCESDENFVPLSLLKLITENGEGIEIESNLDDTRVPDDQKTVSLKVPSYIGLCADLQPKLHQDRDSNLLIVTVENRFPLDELLIGKNKIQGPGVTGVEGNTYSASDLRRMSTTEKFEACMTIRNLLVPDGRGSAELLWPSKKGYKSSVTEPMSISFNPGGNTKIVFGTPREAAREYGAAFGWDTKSKMGFDNPAKCLALEELAPKKGMYLYDGDDRKYVSLKEECEGNYLQIMAGLKKVTDFAERDLFKKILEKELDQKLEIMVQDRFTRITEISKELNNPNLSREDAERLSSQYLTFIREIDQYYTKPKIERLRKLVSQKQMTQNLSPQQKDQMDRDILVLNRQISQYSTGKIDKNLDSKSTMGNLRRLGLTEEAEEIAEFKLYSSYYGRVYDKPELKETRGPKLTIDQAQGQVFKQLAQYKSESQTYDQAYKARTGQGTFSSIYGQRIKQNQEAMNRAYMDYQQQEMKNYSYCQMSMIGTMVNPYKCQQVMSGKAVQQRQQNLMEKIKYYQTKTQKDNEMYKQFFDLERIGREVKEAEKLKQQRRQVENNINEISGNYDDLLDRGNPFTFDYERTTNNIAENNPGNYNGFGINNRPQNPGGNFNMMGGGNGPQGPQGPQGPNYNFMPMPGVPSGPNYNPGMMSGGLNQGGFPIGGYRFNAGASFGTNPGIGQGY
jgi:hypothetical protein